MNLRGLSALKKDQLADRLASEIVNKAQEMFFLFDDSQYRLAGLIVANNGVTDKFELEDGQVEYFRNRGIIFSGTLDGKRVLTMPRELIPWFKDLDNKEYQKIV